MEQDVTSNKDHPMTLTFRCPAELEGLLPAPVPATLGLPDWFKAMPPQAFNAVNSCIGDTVKRCPPFIDAMTYGFLIPLICDLKVENGEFTWDNDLPAGGEVNFVRSPIGFHDASQVTATPLFEDDRFVIKFHNLWTIEAPDGYALLFTHPVNRFDLPFITLTGLVVCDRYHDNWIHFPAHWHDLNFSGVRVHAETDRRRRHIRRREPSPWPAQPEHLNAPAPPQAPATTSREPWRGYYA